MKGEEAVLANSKNSSAAFRSRARLLFGSIMIWFHGHIASILQFRAILDEANNQEPQRPVLDAHEGVHVGGSRTRGVNPARGALEKERPRHLQDLRDVLQPAGTDPVFSVFIFLNLL